MKIISICLYCFTSAFIGLAGDMQQKQIPEQNCDLTPFKSTPISRCFPEPTPGLWSLAQPGLFGIYNSIVGQEKADGFAPYDQCEIPTNSYPKIFYLDINPDVFAEIDTLKYNWQYDEIVSICHDDKDRKCQTMMWSSCDTIYTKGNSVSKKDHGKDIGNVLYDRAIIEEFKNLQSDTLFLKSEINGTHRSRKGFITFNCYCKIIIRNGKITSYFTHIGTLTKQQYRALPEEEKARVKLPKCKHNSDL